MNCRVPRDSWTSAEGKADPLALGTEKQVRPSSICILAQVTQYRKPTPHFQASQQLIFAHKFASKYHLTLTAPSLNRVSHKIAIRSQIEESRVLPHSNNNEVTYYLFHVRRATPPKPGLEDRVEPKKPQLSPTIK